MLDQANESVFVHRAGFERGNEGGEDALEKGKRHVAHNPEMKRVGERAKRDMIAPP
jgi:hypothetical protein